MRINFRTATYGSIFTVIIFIIAVFLWPYLRDYLVSRAPASVQKEEAPLVGEAPNDGLTAEQINQIIEAAADNGAEPITEEKKEQIINAVAAPEEPLSDEKRRLILEAME